MDLVGILSTDVLPYGISKITPGHWPSKIWKYNGKSIFFIFHQLGRLGRVGLVVAMSVCLSVCLYVCLSPFHVIVFMLFHYTVQLHLLETKSKPSNYVPHDKSTLLLKSFVPGPEQVNASTTKVLIKHCQT